MTLEEIVRAFASVDPQNIDRDGDSDCHYCYGYRGSHIEDCPWIAAKLFADPQTILKPAPVEPYEGGLTWVTVEGHSNK